MNIKQRVENNEVIVAIEGDIDTTTASAFSEALQKAAQDAMTLVVDFKHVNYISSAGLRVLLSGQKIMNDKKGKMIVRNVNEDIMEVLELTCFTEILTIE